MENNESVRRDALEALRNNRGFSQESLAQKCGVTRLTVASYETKGSIPKTDVFFRLCQALEVNPIELAKCFGIDVSGVPDQ